MTYSAGDLAVDEVYPLSIKYLQEKGISTEGLRVQFWSALERMRPDVVITV